MHDVWEHFILDNQRAYGIVRNLWSDRGDGGDR